MVFSTSWPYSYRIKGNEIEITRRHVIFVAISILSMLLFSHINFLVLTPLGMNIYNARRWIKLGGFTFMPSDFMKIASIMMMAYVIDRYKNNFTFRNIFLKYFVIAAVSSISVMIQPDFSTTLIIIGTLTAMYVIAGMDKKVLLFSGFS